MMFAGQAAGLATARATGLAIDPAAPPPIPVGLITTPLFHVTANNCGAYALTAGGGKMVLMYRWDAEEALKLIEREKVSAVSGVPVMARELITHPDFAKYDTSSLLTLGAAGAAAARPGGQDRQRGATARPNTGYGMTETCGIITSIAGDFFVDKPASCGRAMPSFEAKVVDDAGNALPAGEPGELWVKGAPVIKGYINRPDATAESITNGWLHTGDVARIDEDGFIFLVDRKKDMVLRGGENIYCARGRGDDPPAPGDRRMLRVRRARRAAGRGGRGGHRAAPRRNPVGRPDPRPLHRPGRPPQGAALRLAAEPVPAPQRQRQIPQEGPAPEPQ